MTRGAVRAVLLGGAFTAVGGGVLLWQQHTQRLLRDEVAALAAQHRALRQGPRPAGAVSPTERPRSASGVAPASADARSAPSEPVPGAPPPRLTEQFVSHSAWMNAGRATPDAAIETALWAAAGGNLAELAASLSLEGDARAKAAALLARMPAAARAQYRTPEELVAAHTAKDIPLGEARLVTPGDAPAEGAWCGLVLRYPAGQLRSVLIGLRRRGNEWRLVVPAAAVDRYAETLPRRDER